MPKNNQYTLAWSAQTQTYELYQQWDHNVLPLVPDSPAWFAWLGQVDAFAFAGQSGAYTARKETRQRGAPFWCAYDRRWTQRPKAFLGQTVNLTMARLEDIAGRLQAAQVFQLVAPPMADVGADPAAMVTSLVAQPSSPQPHLPLLATKLYVPRPRAQIVARPQLIERLQQGLSGMLTLLAAPAGSGKTTLLAQWGEQCGLPVAWLSLEAADNDPTRLLTYLLAALQRVEPTLGRSALALLQTPQPSAPEVVLGVLVNELLERESSEVVLVLDDYHVLTEEAIHRGMIFLLEHRPLPLHLVLATRADPPLPLARLRAQGQLTEVRAADLRFGPEEVRTFLQKGMGLTLPPEALAALESRTEGWIAGLQLAALALQGGTDVATFLATFSGGHRYVLDYLSEEVLARQDTTVQQFLLSTSVLERLSGPLCEAVTGQAGSQRLLEALERANLFVVALDEERQWYRYHQLFAEGLRSILQQREPTLVPVLHRRASAWYAQHEQPTEAVHHALAIPDAALAADLMEPITLPMAFQGHIATVLGWLDALPEALLRARPRLGVYYARLLTYANQFEAAEAWLRHVERSVHQEELSAEQAQTIQGWVLSTRAGIAGFSGNLACANSLARQALELLPEGEAIPRAGALVARIHAYLVNGDVTSAIEQEVTAAVDDIHTSGNPLATVSSTGMLARLYVLQGRLQQAAATYAQVGQMVLPLEVMPSLMSSLLYYFGLGDLLREWNELETAEAYLRQGMAVVRETLLADGARRGYTAASADRVVLGYTALARVQQARGNTEAALATLDALAHLARQRRYPTMWGAQGEAARAQLELAQGHLAAAIRWADHSGVKLTDTYLPYSREGEYLALARVRTAQARSGQATAHLESILHMLERWLRDAQAKGRLHSVLEILVVRALALAAQGNRASALSTLEHALVLAEPEGYLRLFVDEGAPMRALLRHAQAHTCLPGYVATLLAACGEPSAPLLPRPAASPEGLLAPLTARELEVLRLLLEGASNRDIAARLVVGVDTVKRHVYNLCGKLGVKSRTQAIARARTLHLE